MRRRIPGDEEKNWIKVTIRSGRSKASVEEMLPQ